MRSFDGSFGALSAVAHAPILGHYLFGSGPARVMVFHDWMGDAENYLPTLPYLDGEAFTYAFVELRGYGKSSRLTGEYVVEEASADAFRLADALGWTDFSVIGHSMCGMVVQRMAIDDWHAKNRRIRSIVAVAPVAANGYPADQATKDFLWSIIGRKDTSELGFAVLTGQRLSDTWAWSKTVRHLQSSNVAALKGYYNMWLETDFATEAILAGVRTPMLIIGGRQDLPGFQEQHLRDTFGICYPQAQFAFISDAGHYPMEETPAYFAALVERFLATVY